MRESLLCPSTRLDTAGTSAGPIYITRFENTFADYLGIKYAVSHFEAGTGALHLALAALGDRAWGRG